MGILESRIIDLSYKHKLSHIGSCLTAVGIIDKIYQVKKKEEPFILSAGHAGLALYTVLEKYENQDAETLYLKHGTHPNRDTKSGIYSSSGSLGCGITLAVGMALADRSRNVYVYSTDGEAAEGSFWEALRIAGDLRLENLRVVINCNGFGAYGKIDVEALDTRIQFFYPALSVKTNLFNLPDWIQGQAGHYVVMDKQMYEQVTR